MIPVDEVKPYVRIQKPGLLVFPRVALEHFKFTEDTLVYVRFFADYEKRALGFKFLDKVTPEELKEYKKLSIKRYNNTGLQGIVSIKKVLNGFQNWKMPASCTLEEYTDQDEMMSWIGKLNYFIIPEGDTVGDPTQQILNCPVEGCGKQCLNRRSLGQHMRQHKEQKA